MMVIWDDHLDLERTKFLTVLGWHVFNFLKNQFKKLKIGVYLNLIFKWLCKHYNDFILAFQRKLIEYKKPFTCKNMKSIDEFFEYGFSSVFILMDHS